MLYVLTLTFTIKSSIGKTVKSLGLSPVFYWNYVYAYSLLYSSFQRILQPCELWSLVKLKSWLKLQLKLA